MLSQGDNILVQAVLWALILTEGLSAYVRTKAYYTAPSISVDVVSSALKSAPDSSVKSDEVGKAKQTFQMVGSALFVLPVLKYLGLVLLVGAVPLACKFYPPSCLDTIFYNKNHIAALYCTPLLIVHNDIFKCLHLCYLSLF